LCGEFFFISPDSVAIQLLTIFLGRHVTEHSVASFYPPYVPLHGLDPAYDACEDDLPPLENGLPRDMSALCFQSGTSRRTLRIVEDLTDLTADLCWWLKDPNAPFSVLKLQTRGDTVQLRLLRCFADLEQDSTVREAEKALCLALLAFTVLIFRAQHEHAMRALDFTALSKLRSALEASSTDVHTSVPALRLWITAIACIGAGKSAALPWFLEQFSSACDQCEIASFEQLLGTLRSLLWVDCQLTHLLHHQWLSLSHSIEVDRGLPMSRSTTHFTDEGVCLLE
jgi:hypothetical protein